MFGKGLARLAQRHLDTPAQIFGKLASEIGERPFSLVADRVRGVQLFCFLAPPLVLFCISLRQIDHALLVGLRETSRTRNADRL